MSEQPPTQNRTSPRHTGGGSLTMLAPLLRGGGIVVLLLWSLLSFAPIFTLIYGDTTTASAIINWLFALTGIAALGPLYCVLLLLAAPKARHLFYPEGTRALSALAIYAAVWIVLYTFLR